MSDDPAAPDTPESELLDARGLNCPEPLMLVRNRIRAMAPGTVLRVLATDPTTTRDLLNFCRFMRHEMLLSDENEGEFVYLIRRGGG